MERTFLDNRVLVKIGDITLEMTESIVNAANSTLLGGGGVDGAIHARGGDQILEECKKLRKTIYPGGLPTGHSVLTTGGHLSAKFVIHTVGPVYGQNAGRDNLLLSDSYQNSLKIACAACLRTIAFPSISTGAFGFPKDQAARVSSVAIKEFLRQDTSVEKIHLVFFSQADADIFLNHNDF